MAWFFKGSEKKLLEEQAVDKASWMGTSWVEGLPFEAVSSPGVLYESDHYRQGVRFYYPEEWGTIKFIESTDYNLLYVDHPRITEVVDSMLYPSAKGVPWKWMAFQEAVLFNYSGDDWMYWGKSLTLDNEQQYCPVLEQLFRERDEWDRLFEKETIAMTECETFPNHAGHWVTHFFVEEYDKQYNVYLIRYPDDRYQSVALTDLYLSEPFGQEVAQEVAQVAMEFDFLEKPPPYEPTVLESREVVWTGERYQRIETTETVDGYPSWCLKAVEYVDVQSGEVIALPEALEEAMKCYFLPWGITPDEEAFLYFEWNGYESDIPLKQYTIETGEVSTLMSLNSDAEIGLRGFYWNTTGDRMVFVVTKGVSEDYPYGSKVFAFQWKDRSLFDKQKWDAKIKVSFADQGYFPISFGFLDEDTVKYQIWTESFDEWDEWDSFLDDDAALSQEPVYETKDL